MSLTWEFTEDPVAFLAAAGDHLAAAPVVSTVVASVAHRAASGELTRTDGLPFWFAVCRDGAGQVLGATMRTAPFPPYPLAVLPMPPDAAVELAQVLHERGEHPGGGNGALPAARVFAEAAAKRFGATVRVTMHTRLFELGELRSPRPVPGRAREVTESEVDLVLEWFRAFGRAADQQAGRTGGHDRSQHVTREDVLHRIRGGRVLLWDVDGRPVSLAACNPPGFGVVRVGPVYTPDAFRRRGYGSAVTAEISRRLLAEGVRVCLFTDQANPTSNHIYTALGYRPVVDMADHELV